MHWFLFFCYFEILSEGTNPITLCFVGKKFITYRQDASMCPVTQTVSAVRRHLAFYAHLHAASCLGVQNHGTNVPP